MFSALGEQLVLGMDDGQLLVLDWPSLTPRMHLT
jgi:hypothetical protein